MLLQLISSRDVNLILTLLTIRGVAFRNVPKTYNQARQRLAWVNYKVFISNLYTVLLSVLSLFKTVLQDFVWIGKIVLGF